ERYLGRLADRVRERGLPDPLVMQSSGGASPARVAARRAAACLLSGPAGGVVAASYVAGLSGYREALSFDMGGTSTDVAAIIGGRASTATEGSVAGLPVRLPMVDIHTIGAGGGSVAWVDDGGALRVGPRSAGADPGPACYGLGGREPSVTDAAVCLGFIPHGRRLGGSVSIDASAAESAVEGIGRRLGLPVEEAAAGIVRVAEASMAKALRVVSVERGLDPRRFALVAFGGAGPMHACSLADQIGMGIVLVPRACGVLSALGLAISEVRTDASRPLHALAEEAVVGAVEKAFSEMEAGVEEPAAVLIRRADLRYRGQSFELTVEAGSASALVENFHAAHEQRYGYRMDGAPVEIVTLRLTSVLEGSKPVLSEPAGTGRGAASRRRVFFHRWEQTQVFERAWMGAGDRVEGPAIVEFGEATCVVGPGWAGSIDPSGTLVLKRGG
ncbi:MAG: hydantoinase/oxoprolinase family protein, partial [Actinomycetota bacterium]